MSGTLYGQFYRQNMDKTKDRVKLSVFHCTHCEEGAERPTVKYLVNKSSHFPGSKKARPRSRTRWCSGRTWILHSDSESDSEVSTFWSGSRNRREEEQEVSELLFLPSFQGYTFRRRSRDCMTTKLGGLAIILACIVVHTMIIGYCNTHGEWQKCHKKPFATKSDILHYCCIIIFC